jgi:hypothetical protein
MPRVCNSAVAELRNAGWAERACGGREVLLCCRPSTGVRGARRKCMQVHGRCVWGTFYVQTVMEGCGWLCACVRCQKAGRRQARAAGRCGELTCRVSRLANAHCQRSRLAFARRRAVGPHLGLARPCCRERAPACWQGPSRPHRLPRELRQPSRPAGVCQPPPRCQRPRRSSSDRPAAMQRTPTPSCVRCGCDSLSQRWSSCILPAAVSSCAVARPGSQHRPLCPSLLPP